MRRQTLAVVQWPLVDESKLIEMKCILLICLWMVTTIAAKAVNEVELFDSKVSILLTKWNKHEDIIFSPLGMRAALMLNSLGIQQTQANEVRKALNLNDSLSLAVHELEKMLTGIDTKDVKMKVASHVFMSKNVKSNPRLSLLADDLEWVDFDDESQTSLKVACWRWPITFDKNIWREKKKFSIVSSGVLVNTMLFSARWREKSVSVNGEAMIHQAGSFRFSRNVDFDTATMVMLPLNNTPIVMLVAAPNQSDDPNAYRKLEHFLKKSNLTELHKQLPPPASVRVSLPCIERSSEIQLLPIYRALNISRAYKEISLSDASQFVQVSINKNGINVNDDNQLRSNPLPRFTGPLTPNSPYIDLLQSDPDLLDPFYLNDHLAKLIPGSVKGGRDDGDVVSADGEDIKFNSSFFFAIMDEDNVYLAGHIIKN